MRRARAASPVPMESSGSQSAPAHSLFRRTALTVLVFLLVLVAAGFLHQNISEARDRRFNPMQGRLVDAGGRKMHIHCTGDGSPTVILDSGLGDSYLSWMQVELSHLSTRGTQTIAKNSAHYIQIDRPDVVIDAVRNIVEPARQGRSTP